MGASKSKAVYLCLLLFTFVSAVASVDIPVNLPTDPFADPKNDLRNPLRYIPSKTLAAIAIGSYPISIHITQAHISVSCSYLYACLYFTMLVL